MGAHLMGTLSVCKDSFIACISGSAISIAVFVAIFSIIRVRSTAECDSACAISSSPHEHWVFCSGCFCLQMHSRVAYTHDESLPTRRWCSSPLRHAQILNSGHAATLKAWLLFLPKEGRAFVVVCQVSTA